MRMEYLGLLLEFLFLAVGVYLYLFALGRLPVKDEKARQNAEAFRLKNGWWIRLAALALMAVMSVNIFFHIRQLLSGS